MSDVPREFVFTRYPGRQGMVWLRTAYVMFKQHRAPWVMLVLGYFLVLVVVSWIPYVGPYAATILKPVFAVGLLAAAWKQERGGVPEIRQLFQGFRANVLALLGVGLFLMIGISIAVYASSLVDGGKLLELRASGSALTEDQLAARLADPQLQLGMLFSSLLSLPIIVAAWWAPALVVFQDANAGAALAASLRAALANWKALAVYALGVFVYAGIVPGVVFTLLALIVPAAALPLLVTALLLPYWLFLAATLHISDYVSYRDVFHANETLAPLSRGP
jgi:hypothetical protein